MRDPRWWMRSWKACAAGAGAIAFCYGLQLLGRDVLGPVAGVYTVLLTLFLLPVGVCLTTAVGGLAGGLAGCAAALGVCFAVLGRAGAGLCCVYVLPIFAAFLVIFQRRINYRTAYPVMIGVHVAALAAVYVLCQRMAGGGMYQAAGNAAADFLKSWDMGDTMLYQLYSMGLIDVQEELRGPGSITLLGQLRLSDAARNDMLLSVRALVSGMLQGLVPQLIVSQSILGGVGCLLLPLRFGFIAEERRAFLAAPEDAADSPRQVDFPTLDAPPFSLWHLPRGKGWQVGAALAAGYLLRVSPAPATQTAGVLLYAAASAIFSIQGAATVNFLQKSRGARRGWRVAVPILLMALHVLQFIGILDQVTNPRGLRKPREPKEE